jgi:hypothetical protein
MFSFERRYEPVLPWEQFVVRMLVHLAVVLLVIGGSLAVGILGYHLTEGFGWLDSLLNASMILSGMGPADALKTSPGKVFASLYALYSGLALITIAGLLLLPAVHRVLHRFHFDADGQ